MRSQIVQYAATAADGVALPPNPKRRSLVITGYGSAAFANSALLIGFGQSAAVNGMAILWGSGSFMTFGVRVPLNLSTVGEQLCEAIHLATTSASLSVTILEGFD